MKLSAKSEVDANADAEMDPTLMSILMSTRNPNLPPLVPLTLVDDCLKSGEDFPLISTVPFRIVFDSTEGTTIEEGKPAKFRSKQTSFI